MATYLYPFRSPIIKMARPWFSDFNWLKIITQYAQIYRSRDLCWNLQSHSICHLGLHTLRTITHLHRKRPPTSCILGATHRSATVRHGIYCTKHSCEGAAIWLHTAKPKRDKQKQANIQTKYQRGNCNKALRPQTKIIVMAKILLFLLIVFFRHMIVKLFPKVFKVQTGISMGWVTQEWPIRDDRYPSLIQQIFC